MKKIIIISILLIATQIQAQFWKDAIKGNGKLDTEQRKVSDFNKLVVTGPFDVLLLPNSDGKISITADENLLPVIETFVKNGKLIIRFNKEIEVRKYTKLYVVVPVEELKKISLTGSGSVKNQQLIDWDEVSLSVTGSGDIRLKVQMNYIKASVTGSGEIYLTGKADATKLNVTGSGEIDAKNLKTLKSEILLTGSGDIYVDVSDSLKAKVLGSGDLYYYTEPEYIKVNSLGSGDVIDKSK